MKKVTKSNYKKDKYYPKVVKAFSDILIHNNEVRPVDVFQRMLLLTPEDLEDW